MNTSQKYEKALNALHDKVPTPFNLTYNPLASRAMTLAVQSLESEGFYDTYKTPVERLATGKLDQRYREVLEQLEQAQGSTNRWMNMNNLANEIANVLTVIECGNITKYSQVLEYNSTSEALPRFLQGKALKDSKYAMFSMNELKELLQALEEYQ